MTAAQPINYPMCLTMTLWMALAACSDTAGDPMAGSAADNGATPASLTAPGGSPAAEEGRDRPPGIELISRVPEIGFAPASHVPLAPQSNLSACPHFAISARTGAGQLVADAGWVVLGEEPLGRFQAVSFAARFTPGTSGSCIINDGKLAIFEGQRLIGLAQGTGKNPSAIGRVRKIEGATLRLWDGDFAPYPVADLLLEGNERIVLAPVAAQDTVCGDLDKIPNVYGKPIEEARAMLDRAGWKPVAQGPADGRNDPREAGLATRGFTEVLNCSGTGFGYCGFDYASANGALTLTTIGDEPIVLDYAVTCGA